MNYIFTYIYWGCYLFTILISAGLFHSTDSVIFLHHTREPFTGTKVQTILKHFLVPSCILGKGRRYMGPEISLFGKTRGTRVFVTINISSENISVLSAMSVKDMLTVLSSIGWLLSDLSFIGWLLLMRTCKLGQACPTVP